MCAVKYRPFTTKIKLLEMTRRRGQDDGRELLLMRHYVEDHLVGLTHTEGAEAGEVVDAAVHVVLYQALHAAHRVVLDGQHGAEHSRGHSA